MAENDDSIHGYTLETFDGKTVLNSREYTGIGKATYRFDDKEEIYHGEYKFGVREGKGKYWYSNGNFYDGDFKQNRKNGIGYAVYKQLKGDESENQATIGPLTYLGNFIDGRKESKGCCHYANGDVYTGEWLKGRKHGKGTYKFEKDKSQICGYWENGHVKYGTWKLATGICYVGNFKRNKPSGKGFFVFPNGIIFSGYYKHLQNEKEKEETESEPKETDTDEELVSEPIEEQEKIDSVNFVPFGCIFFMKHRNLSCKF